MQSIGVLILYEDDKRSNLKGALLEYITKTDQYVRVAGCRVFGRGVTSKTTTSKAGKPLGRSRKDVSDFLPGGYQDLLAST